MKLPALPACNQGMKNLLFLTLFLVTCNLTASAQRGTLHVHEAATSRRVAQVQTRMMDNRMKLIGEQKTRVSRINELYATRLTSLLNNKEMDQPTKLQELQKLHADKKADLKTILTDEQYKEYLKLQQELQEKRIERIKSSSLDEPNPDQ